MHICMCVYVYILDRKTVSKPKLSFVSMFCTSIMF